ncbi:MAG: citrate/2-methylcitrate synthase [Planctomycetes bacterium]|nr:citrate/2-methylcitrate synthase [Planctomycetota bacterium]
MSEASWTKGMAGVVADATAISSIDGERGELRYRGYLIAELVERASFLEVVGLVVDGELPGPTDVAALEGALADRALPAAAQDVLARLPRDTHPMTVLAVVLPLLDDAASKERPRLGARPAQRAALLALAARLPTVVAAWTRLRRGLAPLAPDPALPLHADFLRMTRGAAPDAREVAVLDATQALQMEHGFNASTFAVRTVASTLAPLSESLAAGVAALHGPLHGGADEAAYRMALEVGGPEAALAWVDAALARKHKIMGLGHREYRVVDPRALVLRPMALDLARALGPAHVRVLETLAAIDDHAAARFAAQGKRIRANVDFYKGAVFAALGLEPDCFTALFAMSRAFGWGAHALELWDDHALYRPRAAYRGAPPREVPRPTMV